MLQERSSELGKNFLRIIRDGLKENKCIVIAPEGHRSRTATLQPAEQGAGISIKSLGHLIQSGTVSDGYIVPIGVYPAHEQHRFPRNKFKFIIGDPVKPTDMVTRACAIAAYCGIDLPGIDPSASLLSHALMCEIASYLPYEYQGVYQRDSTDFKPTILGELKLGIREDGTVGLVRVQSS